MVGTSSDALNTLLMRAEAKNAAAGARWSPAPGATPRHASGSARPQSATAPPAQLLSVRRSAAAAAGAPDPPHSSLLATPASRHTGGRLAGQPTPATLSLYERGLEAEIGLARSRAAAAAPSTAAGRFNPAVPASPLTGLSPRPGATAPAAAAAAGRTRLALGSAAGVSAGSGSAASPRASLVDKFMAATAARAPAADPLAPYLRGRAKPAGAAAAAAGSAAAQAVTGSAASTAAGLGGSCQLHEQVRQLQLEVEHTTACNSALVASSRGAAPLPEHGQLRQPDFFIKAAYASSRATAHAGAPGSNTQAAGRAAETPVSARGTASGRLALPAAAAAAAGAGRGAESGEPVVVGLRLSTAFNSLPAGGSQQLLAAAVPATAQQVSRGQQVAGGAAAAGGVPAAASLPVAGTAAAGTAAGGGDARPEFALLVSYMNELEAKLRLEQMRAQEAEEQHHRAQQQLHQQAEQAEVVQQLAQQAEARAQEAEARRVAASQQVGMLQTEAECLRAALSARAERQAGTQAGQISLLQQENHALQRQLQQEQAQVARLQQSLLQQQPAVCGGEAQHPEQPWHAEGELEQRLQSMQQQAEREKRELVSRCQRLAVEKAAHEQAAMQAVAQQEAAERRSKEAEERCCQLVADLAGDSSEQRRQLQAAHDQAAAASQQAAATERLARSLRQQLLEAQQRCRELEAALEDEQQRSSSNAARAEVAEVAQQGLDSHVRATHARLLQLQDQLAASQQELQRLRHDNEALRDECAGRGSLEAQLSEAEADREQLRQRVEEVSAELDAYVQAAGQHRQQVAALQQGEHDLRAALQQGQLEAMQLSKQVVALQNRAETLGSRVLELEGDLLQARQQATAAEDRLIKSSRAGNGPSPLRDIVNELRQELDEKSLQLMQLQEDLGRERSRSQELHKQLLDQAVELDELQRDSSDTYAARQQLAAAQQAEAQLRQVVKQLRQQLAAAGGATASSACGGGGCELSPRSCGSGGSAQQGSCSSPARAPGQQSAVVLQGRLEAALCELAAAKKEVERLKAERDRLRDEVEARDAEVMQLQGQVVMLQAQIQDDGNWLAPLPDPL